MGLDLSEEIASPQRAAFRASPGVQSYVSEAAFERIFGLISFYVWPFRVLSSEDIRAQEQAGY